MNTAYDYIIAGGGASGLSLAIAMCVPYFLDKSILIIDKEVKEENDHTWCFWEKGQSDYDKILSNSFSHIFFHSKNHDLHLDIQPYRYKMLQANRFYAFAKSKFAGQSNIKVIRAKVNAIKEYRNHVLVKTDQGTFQSQQLFKSFVDNKIDKTKYLYVAQHFKGWFIETKEETFDPGSATFMDFRIGQKGEVRFFYVLPVTPTTALVEIAIFSNAVMAPEDYDPLIEAYIEEYTKIDTYQIQEKEFGIIPMTDYPFWQHNTARVLHIGGAGGAIKASSGYAFARIQEHTREIIKTLKNKQNLRSLNNFFKDRFYLYDQTLLDVILKQSKPADLIFENLFTKNPPQQIFKFLDRETTILEEARIFIKMPQIPFIRGFFRQMI